MKALTLVAAVAVAGVVVTAYPAGAPQAQPPDLPCKPAAAHSPTVGEVERTSGTVYQGKNAVKQDGANLFTNATLCTADGRVTFRVTPLKLTSCEMRPGARLRLYPPKQKNAHRQVVIRFEDGKTYCGTGNDANDRKVKYDARKGQTRLLMTDPLFAVDVDENRTLVQVELGYLEVSRRMGEGKVIIGPGQQVTVAELAKPGVITAIEKTADDQDTFDALRPKTPDPEFSRPDAADSATLKRIFSRKSMTVGVDTLGDKTHTDFVREFFAFLGSSWGLKVSTREATTTTLVTQLKAQRLDVAVVSDPKALTPFDTLPFLSVPPRLWELAVVRDARFLASLRGFVRTAVSAGEYRRYYRSAFLEEPPLDPLRPILFP